MRRELTKKEAIGLLPEGESVHTFVTGGFLVGADWSRDDVIEKINEAEKVELSGPFARGMGHGMVIFPPNAKYQSDLLFVETDMKKLNALDPDGGEQE